MKRSHIAIPLASLSAFGLVSCEIGSEVVESGDERTPSYFETMAEKEAAQNVTTGTHSPPPGPGTAVVTPAPSTPSVAQNTTNTTPTPDAPDTPTPDGGAPAPPEGMINLETEFPTPMFVGTPVPVKLPNLEPPGKPKKTMPVPAGTKNVAAGKPVTSSDPEPTIGELDFATDGDKEGGDGYFVELGPGTQWIQVDLEKEYNIHAVFFWHFHKSACAYFDVVVQISNDPEFVEATTIYNNDHDNSSGLGVGSDLAYIETNHGRLIDGKGTKGRYVRLHSNGNTANDLNHYIEIEVHATE